MRGGGRQNYPHIPLPFSIISFKPDNSESNLSELVCHAMCVTAGEEQPKPLVGSRAHLRAVITAAALKWWNSLVRIINRLCCTHKIFTFP